MLNDKHGEYTIETDQSSLEMLIILILLCHFTSNGHCSCLRSQAEADQDSKVFFVNQEANTFLSRRLLFNRFDFEIFTPGNLERECYEEICNYEEAREVFENVPDTNVFWRKYTQGNNENQTKIDVTALLVGIISTGVIIVIIGLLVWYVCQKRNKLNGFRGSLRRRSTRSNASVIIRRLEEVSLHPVGPSGNDAYGLPSYEQAVAITGPHDVPPPPYPGYHCLLFTLAHCVFLHVMVLVTSSPFKKMNIAGHVYMQTTFDVSQVQTRQLTPMMMMMMMMMNPRETHPGCYMIHMDYKPELCGAKA